MNRNRFRDDLRGLINRHSMENGSNTPDFILADFVMQCLDAFDIAANRRSVWYSPPEQSRAISDTSIGMKLSDVEGGQ